MTIIPLPDQQPLTAVLRAFCGHATDCITLSLDLALDDRTDGLAWVLDSRLHDLEHTVSLLRRELGLRRFEEAA